MISLWQLIPPPNECSIYNFALKKAKCAMFAVLSHKGICESINTFLQHMLAKRNVTCIASKALKLYFS